MTILIVLAALAGTVLVVEIANKFPITIDENEY